MKIQRNVSAFSRQQHDRGCNPCGIKLKFFITGGFYRRTSDPSNCSEDPLCFPKFSFISRLILLNKKEKERKCS